MAGTIRGGRRAAATNKQRYGEDFYRQIGKMGGSISRGGGFTNNRELAARAGRVGGLAGKGRKIETIPSPPQPEPKQPWWKKKRVSVFEGSKLDEPASGSIFEDD